MPHSPPARPASTPDAAPLEPVAERVACLLVVIASAVVVYAGATRYGFSQDDFAGLARATGLLPALGSPWRWLSQQAFFDAGHRLFGLEALPYHAASVAVHAACSGLLWAFLHRRVSAPAAAVGAAFFATHPAAYTAVYWIAAIGDPLALAFGLGMLLLFERRDAWRWAALATFALSLLSKESTLLMPFVLPFLAWGASRGPSATRPAPARDPLLIALLALSVGFAVWLVGFGGTGAPAEPDAARPYAVGFGPHVAQNLLTYAGWMLDVPAPLVTSYSDAIDFSMFGRGLGLIAVWVAGCFSSALRRRGWIAAGVYFGLLLLVVLPLRNHTYHYYAYAALPGIAWMVAAAFDALLASRVRALSGATAFGLLAVLTLNGRAVVQRIESAPLGDGPLRADPTVDRALVLERVTAGIGRAALPAGARLWFWSPVRITFGPDSYWERNVRAATYEGMAIRVLFPAVREVRFVPELAPADADVRYAIYGIDGRTDVFTWAALDSILRSTPAPPR